MDYAVSSHSTQLFHSFNSSELHDIGDYTEHFTLMSGTYSFMLKLNLAMQILKEWIPLYQELYNVFAVLTGKHSYRKSHADHLKPFKNMQCVVENNKL